jgi:SSS family solute:Na+ symporter
MLLIGKFYPRAVPYEQQYTRQVEITPYKYVKQVGLGVVLTVVFIYIYFAK